MKSTLLGGAAVLVVLAGIPATAAAQSSQTPPGLERSDTLPPGLEKQDPLPPGLQGRGLEDYGDEGQTATNRDRALVPGEPQQAATDDSLKKSGGDTAAEEHRQDQKLDELPKAK